MRIWIPLCAVLSAIAALIWGSDKITLEGERTVYTVDCRGGSWQGSHCTGRLVESERFRFRALKPHREVVFWTAGSGDPSGKFSDCDIKDGRNWTCRPGPDATRTITLQMKQGEPVADASGLARSFHAVSKWTWYMLRAGLPMGSEANP